MTGPLALHGGGEFQPGDEPFLRAILERAPRSGGMVRAAVVPLAAARGRPDLAGANGVAALQRVAEEAGIPIEARVVPVVDRASAGDPRHADALRAATLIHLPGGDPDIIPTLLPGTPALAGLVAAWGSGAVLAGASAGAMAFGSWTWAGEDHGLVPGLALVPAVVVVPHADATSWPRALGRYGAIRPTGTGVLGLGERTAVIVPAESADPWQVVGHGEVRWLAPDQDDPAATAVRRAGETLSPGDRPPGE